MSVNLTVETAGSDSMNEIWAICTEMANGMAYPIIFCSGAWLKASADNLCPGDELLVLLVKNGSSIRAVLPLVKKRNYLGGNDMRFLGTDFYPDPLGLISSLSDRPSCAAAIKKYLLSVEGWDRLILDWVLADELLDWELPGKKISVEPYTQLSENFNDLQAEFKQKKQFGLKSMTRKLNKFMNAGGKFVCSTDKHTHEQFLDNLFVLHQKRSASRSINNTFTGLRVRTLHQQIIKKEESVRFFGLRLGNQLVAVIYGFEFGNRFFYYQIAHDPEYADFSPGSVLIYCALEFCCSKQIREFNFLQGDESYKHIWANNSRELYRCVLGRGTWRSKLLDLAEKTREKGKKAAGLIRHGN